MIVVAFFVELIAFLLSGLMFTSVSLLKPSETEEDEKIIEKDFKFIARCIIIGSLFGLGVYTNSGISYKITIAIAIISFITGCIIRIYMQIKQDKQ